MTAPLKNINTLIGMKAGEAFERLFGTKPPKTTIEINDTVKEYNNARSWWERASGAAIQCNKTIGKIGDINNAGIPCYICGIPMTTEFDSVSAECEHILPIYQASLLLKLYHNESEDGNKATKKIMSEYDNKCIIWSINGLTLVAIKLNLTFHFYQQLKKMVQKNIQ